MRDQARPSCGRPGPLRRRVRPGVVPWAHPGDSCRDRAAEESTRRSCRSQKASGASPTGTSVPSRMLSPHRRSPPSSSRQSKVRQASWSRRPATSPRCGACVMSMESSSCSTRSRPGSVAQGAGSPSNTRRYVLMSSPSRSHSATGCRSVPAGRAEMSPPPLSRAITEAPSAVNRSPARRGSRHWPSSKRSTPLGWQGERVPTWRNDSKRSQASPRSGARAFCSRPCSNRGSTPVRSRARALRLGLVLNAPVPGVLRLAPPLTVSTAEVDQAVGMLGAALGSVSNVGTREGGQK